MGLSNDEKKRITELLESSVRSKEIEAFRLMKAAGWTAHIKKLIATNRRELLAIQEIPELLSKKYKERVLTLYHNKLMPSLPEGISLLTSLVAVYFPKLLDFGQGIKVVSKLPNLEQLVTDEGMLKEVPKELGLLRVKRLIISKAQIKEEDRFWEEVLKIKTLERLMVLDSGLKTLPDEIITLPNLQYLSLSRNELTIEAIPKGFSKLKGIEEVSLSGNRILPEEIKPLQAKMDNLKYHSYKNGSQEIIIPSL